MVCALPFRVAEAMRSSFVRGGEPVIRYFTVTVTVLLTWLPP